MDESRIKNAIRTIIEEIGDDPDREGLKDTPDRVVRMYKEIFMCYGKDPQAEISAIFKEEYDDMIVIKDIDFYSMCEHHMLPFFGKAHIGYVQEGSIMGLSKAARLVTMAGRRLQIQERMTRIIAKSIQDKLKPKGVMVMLEAEHLCMSMRGIKKPGAKTITVYTEGVFREDKNLRDKFYEILDRR